MLKKKRREEKDWKALNYNLILFFFAFKCNEVILMLWTNMKKSICPSQSNNDQRLYHPYQQVI